MVGPVNCRFDSAVPLDIRSDFRELVEPMEQQQIFKELNRFLSEPRLRRLYTEVEAAFKKHDLGAHDWEHVKRVIMHSVEIGLEEHADMSIVIPAAIQHDLGYATNPDDPEQHPVHGARECHQFLDDWSPKDRDLIAGCIRKHKGKYPGYANSEPETREEQVVCDADQIDKFGWVGLFQMLRVYAEQGMIGMEPYDTIAGLAGGIANQGSIAFYTEAGKRLAADLADPDFGEIARKVADQLSRYEGWRKEF